MDHLYRHVLPSQVKPSKKIGGKVRARHHDLIALAQDQARCRNANCLRGAGGDRNFLGAAPVKSGDSRADATRQAKILWSLQAIRVAF